MAYFGRFSGSKCPVQLRSLLEDEGLCGRLDAVVTLRGEIAHTGDAPAEDRLSPDILARVVVSPALASCTVIRVETAHVVIC